MTEREYLIAPAVARVGVLADVLAHLVALPEVPDPELRLVRRLVAGWQDALLTAATRP